MQSDRSRQDLEIQKMNGEAVASAGRAEKGDMLVSIRRLEKGGITQTIDSSVKSMFGDHIRATVDATLKTLGVEHAAVEMKDVGALDYVIQARVEAAARQLWTVKEPGALPRRGTPLQVVKKERLRRTRLYLPGNNPDLMLNAGLYGSDCIILDLEDSVAPADKDAARVLVRNALLALDFADAERIVRINSLSTEFGPKDVEMILPVVPDTVLIPKCESKTDVKAVEEMIIYHEQRSGLDRTVFLMPLIETAKGVLNAYEIASGSERVVAICFGAEDFTADIGTDRSSDGKESFVARSLVVLAAKAAGVQAIDTVFSDVNDYDGLIKSTKEAIALGFDGKGVIHPNQIKPIHQAFAPTVEQVENARKVIAALKEAAQKGQGVASLGSKMIDAPVVARAKQILKMAKLNNLCQEDDSDAMNGI